MIKAIKLGEDYQIITCKSVDVFVGIHFVSVDLYVCFYGNTMLLG